MVYFDDSLGAPIFFMNYYGFVSFFNGIVAFLLALYLLPKNKQNTLYSSFAAFSLSVAFWSILYALWQAQSDYHLALYAIRAAMAVCYFIPFSFLWFVQNITGEKEIARVPSYFFVPLAYSLLNFTPWMIPRVEPRLFFNYWPVPGPLMHVCVLHFNGVVIYGLFLLGNAWRKAYGARRWQLRWIFFTILIMWAGGSTNWLLWYNIPVPPAPNFFVAVCLMTLAYAIINRRLFDIDALAEIVRQAKLSALGMMSASLNHELRNPLFIVRGKLESLLDSYDRDLFPNHQELKTHSRNTIESTLHQMNRAFDIIQRFSDFAKPQGSSFLEKEKVELPQTVEDVLKLVSKEFEMKKIRISEKPEEEIAVKANRRQLEEIFFNLVINACHAMGEKGGELSIKAHQPKGKVVVEVSDTGVGIAKENQRRIFEPFFTTKSGKGTGLGLYITKQLVERNGGKISVASKPGLGTKFTLEFQGV